MIVTMKLFVRCLIITLLFIAASVAQANPKQLKQINVMLDWLLNPNHAPLFVAQQEGFFAKQGLKVRIITPVDPSDGPRLVAAGNDEIAIDYGVSLFEQINQGLPLMRIGALVDQAMEALGVLESSGIKGIKDLKGKKVAVSSTAIDKLMLSTMLKKYGLSLKDITLINVKYNLVQALLTHRVDAVSGIMRNIEPFEIAGALGNKDKLRLFYPEDNGFPEYSELIWVINSKNKEAPWVAKFLLALKQATHYLKQHPDETWQAFIKAHPELDNEVNQRAWYATIPYFANDPSHFDQKNYRHLANFLKQHQFIQTIPAVNRYTIESK